MTLWIKVTKIAIGSTVSILLAYALGLLNAVSAGIITILSVQDTKKQTIRVAIKRIAAFIAAYLLMLVIFSIVPFSIPAFGVFLLLFAGICVAFNMQDALPINAVIATHYLLEQDLSLMMLKNEAMLLLIGTLIGIAINMFMPGSVMKIRKQQIMIEEHFRLLLTSMSKKLIAQGNDDEIETLMEDLRGHIDEGKEHAFRNDDNTFFQESKYYMQYMELRSRQIDLLADTYEKMQSLTMTVEYMYAISDFMNQIAKELHETYNTEGLFVKQGRLMNEIKHSQLPTTREEFENRAILYIIFMNLKMFIKLKKSFIDELSEQQKNKYWK
ncbi:MAG: aromatic acid exporter family protein [Lachnospiraceae bacterium]